MEESKTFRINSSDADRLSGTESDFAYFLNVSPNIKYDRIVLMSCMIPISYYLIDRNHNTFVLDEGGQQVVIEVPIGNYKASTFMTVLMGLLNQHSPTGATYGITISEVTAKFTYNVTPSTTPASFIMTNHLGYQMGFELESTNTFVDGTITSTNVVTFVPLSAVYIHTDMIPSDSSNDTNVLQEVYTSNAVPFSYLSYLCPDPLSYSKSYSNHNTGNVFHFSITDSEGEVLDTNGLPVLLTIMLFKKQNITKLLKASIQLSLLKHENQIDPAEDIE